MRDGLIVDIETVHEDAEIPEYQNKGDAGMDLKAVEKIKDSDVDLWFKTGLKINIPDGYVGLIYPRSSITQKPLQLGNGVGIIDSGYRGEIQVRFRKFYDQTIYDGNYGLVDTPLLKADYKRDHYEVGDRVAQLIIMPYPHVSFREVDDLEDTERGEGGFGSTN